MNSRTPLALLGGLSPSQFMQRHWQKKPLLVRQAVPGFQSPLSVQDLKALAGQDDVESRLIVKKGPNWRMRQGPLNARSFPARSLRDLGQRSDVFGRALPHDPRGARSLRHVDDHFPFFGAGLTGANSGIGSPSTSSRAPLA